MNVALGFLLLLALSGLFLWSAERDAKRWVTAWDRIAHPYSRLTKALSIVYLLALVPIVALITG